MPANLRRSLLLLFPLLLACEGEAGRDPAMDPGLPGLPEEAPAALERPEARTIALRALDGPGISGVARLTLEDTVVRVEITLVGTTAGASHAARIYAGSCAEPETMLADLEPILAEGGRTSVERRVTGAPFPLLDSRAALMIYAANGVVAGPGVACGEIAGEPGPVDDEAGVTPPPVLPPAADP